MRLLGTNKVNSGLLPCSICIDEQFVSYYKKPHFVSADGSEAIFLFSSKPKYRYVTVPKTTKRKTVLFTDGKKRIIMSSMLKAKDGDEVNVIDFGDWETVRKGAA